MGAHRPPIRSHLRFPKTSIHSRIVFPKLDAPSVHSRLVFPPLPLLEEGERGTKGLTPAEDEVRVIQGPLPAGEDDMSWYPGMSENRPASGGAMVIRLVAMAEEATKYRTRGVFLVAPNRP